MDANDLDHLGYEPDQHDEYAAVCEVCNGRCYWIECPTGGWWKHHNHPFDDHDAEAPNPEHIDGEAGG